MPVILQQGDKAAYDEYKQEYPQDAISYDPFQKLLYVVRAKAVADANFVRVLFLDEFANGYVKPGFFLDELLAVALNLLGGSNLIVSDNLKRFLGTQYRQMFTVASVPVTLAEQVGRLYSPNGVSAEEYKRFTAQSNAGPVVEVKEIE